MNNTLKLAITSTLLLLSGCQVSLFDDLSLKSFNKPNPYIAEAIEHNPDNFHAWFLLGKENLDAGQAEPAILAFGKAKSLKPGFEEARLGIGYCQLQLKKWRSAETEFRELLTLNPKSPEALEGLSLALLELDETVEAKSTAQKALELDSELPRAHAVLGRLAYADLDYKTAEAEWKKALELGFPPQDLEPLYQDLRRMLEKYGESTPAQ